MPKGGGYYPPPTPVPASKRAKPLIALLTEREIELMAVDGCDRRIGYGVWDREKKGCESPPKTPATHRIQYHCPRHDRRDDAIVCGKCAARFAQAHDLELP